MIRHCGGCGAALPGGRPATCSACGRVEWRNAKPCAAALVTRDDRLLLVRRAHPPWHGLWCAPSGFCDGPEHPVDAAEREVREEAGVDARVTAYLGTWLAPYTDSRVEPETEYVSVQYYLAVPGPRPDVSHDTDEVSELGWFGRDELPTELAPPGVLHEILAAWRIAVDRVTPSPLADRGVRRD